MVAQGDEFIFFVFCKIYHIKSIPLLDFSPLILFL